jgi:hypothetical protein
VYDLVAKAGSAANGVRARHGRRYGDSARFAIGKGQAGAPWLRFARAAAVTHFAQLGKDLTEALEKIPARHSPYPAQAVLPVVLADIAGGQRPTCRSRKVGPGPVSSPMS